MANPITNKQRQVITRWLYLIGFLDLFGVSVIIPLVSHRIRELGGNAAIAGVFGSLYGGLQLFSSPVVGNLSDLLGRRRVIIICLLFTSVGYALLGFSNTLVFMALARIPTGIFKHSSSLAKAYISDIYDPKEQPGIFGKFNAIANAGFIVGPLCGGHLAMTDNGFLKVSLLSSSIFFANSLLVYMFFSTQESHHDETLNIDQNGKDELLLQDDEQDEQQGLLAIFHNLWKLPWGKVYGILTIRFLMAMSVMFFRGSFSIFLEDRYHANAKTIGYVLSYNGVIGGMSGFVVGKISALYKGDSVKAVLHCDLVVGLAILGCTFSDSLWVFCLCLLPLSISSNLARVHFTSILVSSGKGKEHGALIGVGQSTLSLGRMLSPSIVGFLQIINVFLPGIVAVLFNVAAAIFIVFYMKPIKASKHE
ncbi:uncharacterized protein TRIADDRAFT_25848 [Trichoplax adhaerens]|uniref:Major facilitator superfamily (MFS) profile domain-containing protein n=1 Tax=Trichoplax adhaerens TaxID=10228 RepID=B3RXQ7_TRIAD|nr:hypothetical protein TRIADDRAFT_25848 [Trichoplax adhaerens]EDV24900.1 hypothetical protein TRIADDRAFT_25848 [Trichoplax adhaerens]|eukprot:XP_002112790.1 hypothetical protein TRIADDRAFT_25848 [Trichoplax adhaerens]